MADTEGADPLHIGNVVAIASEAYGMTTGTVVYRDVDTVRIREQGASDRAITFPMLPDGSFAADLGVSAIEIVETVESPYYVDCLGVRPGEVLEFFKGAGEEAAPSGEVAEVMKSATKDSVRLTDGRTIRFRGRGPPLPIEVVRVRTAANIAAEAAGGAGEDAAAAAAAATEAAAATRRTDIMALLSSVLPAATVEVVPTAERTFPDAMQREDLFQDLIGELSDKQRKNPRRIRRIEREVDVALSLKNISLTHDATGRITGTAPYEYLTVEDIVTGTGAPIPAAIPIVKAARTLNLDLLKPAGQAEDLAYNAAHVEPRMLYDIERDAIQLAENYQSGAAPVEGARDFYSFMYSELVTDQHTLAGARPREWAEDQDVIRTAGLGTAVQGLSKGLYPAAVEGGAEEAVTLAHLIGDVTDRNVRVLAPSYHTLRTGAQTLVAPTDPSEVVGYVILPAKAAISLRPPRRAGDLPTALLYSAALQDDNLPTITQTIRDLYTPEAGETLHAWTLDAGKAKSMAIAKWLEVVLRYAVHPADSLGPRSTRLLSLLDVLGVGEHNLAAPVATVIRRWVSLSQRAWRDILTARRAAVQKVLDAEGEREYQSVTGTDSPVWAALRGAEPLADFMADIKRRNPTIGDAPTLISATFAVESQGDAAPIAWSTLAALDGRALDRDAPTAAAALAASRAYALRRKALRDLALLSMRAEPEVSTCPHAARLEAIRNLRDVLHRSRLLREFVEEYQGGRQGEWMTCALCTKPCVCYHELMELEALSQPARMDAIQKQILVRYGGERYQGKIVCKNCGQALQDIEYDEHVEFDDEGRPIAQGSVLTEEQMAEPGESGWKKAVADLAPPPVVFATQSQRDIGDALQVIVERGGLLVQPDVVRQIVRYADLYVSIRAPTQAAYEAFRARAMTAASTKIRTATGASAASIDVQTYSAMIDQLRVVSLCAVLAIALQAADPPIVVNNPFPLCPLSREGWPLAPEGKPDESGAVRYVACVVASIQRDVSPWRFLSWAGDTKIEARQKKITTPMIQAMSVILSGDPKTGPLSFTPEIRTMLAKAQTDTVAAMKRALISHTDELPASFRPEPFPPAVEAPALERDPLPALEAAASLDNETLAQVAAAARLQGIATAAALHAAATAGRGGPKSDVCCPVPIAEAERGALRGPAAATLTKAQQVVRRRIPVTPSAGTHLWSAMAEPVVEAPEPVVEPDVFFKLFLKYCYRGPAVGEGHEFSAGNTCRQCGFALGGPADLVDIAKDGATIMAAQQGDLRIETTQGAFDALSDAVRRRRILVARPVAERVEWMSGLQALIGVARGRAEIPEGAGPRPLATALETVLTEIAGRGAAGVASLDEIGRATLWAPVTMLMDDLRGQIADRIGPLVPRAPGRIGEARAREAATALATFDSMTEDPFIEGPRALQEYWCAKTMSAGKQFYVDKVRPFIPVTTAQWVKMPPALQERLDRFMRDNSRWYAGEVGGSMLEVLRRVAVTLGPLLRLWVQRVRPVTGGVATAGWGIPEAQTVLRCLVLQVWRDALEPTSWMYNDIVTAADRETASARLSDWTRALMFHVKQQYTRYTRDRIKQILQQRAELERTSVVKEFEDLKDDDERAAALAQMNLRIGRWGAGGNIRDYSASQLEFEIEQRRRMGVADQTVEQIALEGAAPAAGAGAAGGDAFGFNLAGGPEAGYDVDFGAAGDDY